MQMEGKNMKLGGICGISLFFFGCWSGHFDGSRHKAGFHYWNGRNVGRGSTHDYMLQLCLFLHLVVFGKSFYFSCTCSCHT